jgi:hypothetical protein
MTPETTPAPATELLRKVREQGVAGSATFEHLLGAGKELWVDDAEFNRFLAAVEATRVERG